MVSTEVSKSWAGGSTTRWRRLRLEVLARDGWRCRIALAGTWVTRRGETARCLGRADCAHHTRGRSVTGDDPRFIVAACSPCNLRVGDPTKAVVDPRPRPRTKW